MFCPPSLLINRCGFSPIRVKSWAVRVEQASTCGHSNVMERSKKKKKYIAAKDNEDREEIETQEVHRPIDYKNYIRTAAAVLEALGAAIMKCEQFL